MTRLVVILFEVWLVGLFISAIIHHNIPIEPAYWIVVIFEVALGFISYLVFKHYLTDKRYQRWFIVFLLLSIIGFGVPIILSHTVDSLKTVSGTWNAYAMTLNSSFIYRIIKKEPLVRQDITLSSYRRRAKIVHLVLISLVPIMILTIVLLPIIGYSPFDIEEPPSIYPFITIYIIIIIPMLLTSLFVPRLAGWIYRGERHDMYATGIFALRSSIIITAAFLNMLMGIIGAHWAIWLLFMIICGILLIYTFPTEKRWEQLISTAEKRREDLTTPKPIKGRGETFKYNTNRCPYCNSLTIESGIIYKAKTDKEREELGYRVKRQQMCLKCRPKWVVLEK